MTERYEEAKASYQRVMASSKIERVSEHERACLELASAIKAAGRQSPLEEDNEARKITSWYWRK